MVLMEGLKRTELYGNANTFVTESGGGFNAGGFGEDAFAGRTRSIDVKIGTTFLDVRDCVSKVFESWIRLNAENRDFGRYDALESPKSEDYQRS